MVMNSTKSANELAAICKVLLCNLSIPLVARVI